MSEKTAAPAQTYAGERIITPSELTLNDGQNGGPAYIAINGVVYDVTNVQLLKDGRHHGITPGNDVSDQFVHNKAILNRLQVVGKLE